MDHDPTEAPFSSVEEWVETCETKTTFSAEPPWGFMSEEEEESVISAVAVR